MPSWRPKRVRGYPSLIRWRDWELDEEFVWYPDQKMDVRLVTFLRVAWHVFAHFETRIDVERRFRVLTVDLAKFVCLG